MEFTLVNKAFLGKTKGHWRVMLCALKSCRLIVKTILTAAFQTARCCACSKETSGTENSVPFTQKQNPPGINQGDLLCFYSDEKTYILFSYDKMQGYMFIC